MYEKRVHIRVPVGIEGSYHPVTRLAVPRLGITQDLSLGGARFASIERLEPGDKISMSLTLPKQGEITLTGLVVWSRIGEQKAGGVGYEAGLSWENIDAPVQARLNSFLTEYTRYEQPVIVTSGPAASQFSWLRAVAFGVAAYFVISAAAFILLTLQNSSSENRSLKTAIQSYQHLIEQVSLHSR